MSVENSLRTSISDTDIFRIIGRPSRYFSVPGTIFPKVGMGTPTSVSFTINNGQWTSLTLGPDRARLVGKGDFVADIPWENLKQGTNSFCLLVSYGGRLIESFEQSFKYFNEIVTVETLNFCFRGKRLPGEIGALSVDGLWRRQVDGVSPLQPGYDRIIALGDMSLTDYTVTAEITIHGFTIEAPGYPTEMGPGVGILVRWTGHYPDGCSPSREWRPIGALGWYRYGRDEADTVRDYRLQLLGGRIKEDTRSEPIAEDVSGKKLPFGIPQTFKIDIKSSGTGPALYRFKVWQTGTEEPSGWDLEGFGLNGEAQNGAVLIVLHYAEATIHNVSIIRRSE